MSGTDLRKNIVLVLGSVVALLITVALWSFYNQYEVPPGNAFAACFNLSQNSTASARCLEDTAKSLLETKSVPEVLSSLVSTSSPEIVRDQCHPIGHIIGEEAYRKYGSIETALSKCTQSCRFACTHGVIGAGVLDALGEEYIGEDVAHASVLELKKLGKKYCGSGDTLCHGMGHVAYIATDRDMEGSVQICDAVSADSFNREVCYQGLFMERAGTFINLLFPSATGTLPAIQPGDYAYPCSAMAEKSKHACYLFLNSYQEPVFVADGIRESSAKLAKARSVCESLPVRDRAYCFEGIGTSAAFFGYGDINSRDAERLCGNFATLDDRSACVLGILPQFYYQDLRGFFGYCKSIAEEGRRSICYAAAFQHVLSGKGRELPKACSDDAQCSLEFETFSNTKNIRDYRFGLF